MAKKAPAKSKDKGRVIVTERPAPTADPEKNGFEEYMGKWFPIIRDQVFLYDKSNLGKPATRLTLDQVVQITLAVFGKWREDRK